MIEFFVQGDPKAQPRPRAFARRMGNTWAARVYDAGTAEEWKSLIAVAARPHIPSAPMEGGIFVGLHFLIRRPKGHFGKRGLLPSAPKKHLQKPDIENLEKAVLDACTQLRFWVDDSQVDTLYTMKRWANENQAPGLWIRMLAADYEIQDQRNWPNIGEGHRPKLPFGIEDYRGWPKGACCK